jgi:hypothetical protein
MRKLSSKVQAVLVSALVLAGVAGPVFATGPDTTAITGAITDAGTAGAVVGAAVVVMIVGIKVFKWLRKAL